MTLILITQAEWYTFGRACELSLCFAIEAFASSHWKVIERLTAQQFPSMDLADVHNGKMSCSTSPCRASQTAKSNLQNKENHRASEKKTCKYWTTHSAFAESAELFVWRVFFCLMCSITMCPADGHQRDSEQSQSIVCHRHRQGRKKKLWFHRELRGRSLVPDLKTIVKSTLRKLNSIARGLLKAATVFEHSPNMYTSNRETRNRRNTLTHDFCLYQNTSWSFLSIARLGAREEK